MAENNDTPASDINELANFLKTRGVDQECITRIEEDKIDFQVIGLMPDDTLKDYLPKYGDRIALVSFAKYMSPKCGLGRSQSSDRKWCLGETLKEKVRDKMNAHFTRSKAQHGNSNARRQERHVEIGLMEYSFELKEYKQVYQKTGGGIKHETFPIDTTLSDILEKAKTWFFPKGDSRRGKADEFNFFITDSSHAPLEEHTTVDEMYEQTKVKLLRLYIASKRKIQHEDVETTEESTPANSLSDISSCSSVPMKKTKTRAKKMKITPCDKGNINVKNQEQHAEEDMVALPDLDVTSEEAYALPFEEITSLNSTNSHLVIEPSMFIDAGTPTVQEKRSLPDWDLFHQTSSSSSLAGTSRQAPPPQMVITDDEAPPNPSVSQPSTSASHMNDNFEQPRSPTPPCHDVVSIHRTKVQQEMISLFMDPKIVVAPVKYRFVDEKGADAQGVSQEVYSAFWQEFFETSSVGEYERVPVIFPDFGREEWEAIGRIILKGYIDSGVYPVKLSYAFSCAAIYGEAELSGDIFVESLRMYLADTDKSVVDKALMCEELDSDDRDDFLDLLGRVNCHSIPSNDEIRPMIISIAHKELIQQPKYALDAIASVAGPDLRGRMKHPEALREMYDSKTPNPRKVVKLLQSSPSDQDEAAALSFLKQFIKGLDDRMLKKFLRHVTGSEYICTQHIEVTFNKMMGFSRAPQAHTCGPVLELPSTYRSYPELRNEFMHILDANYLIMDIV